MQIARVVFICDGNVARSQEAELFFNQLSEGRYGLAVSAGVNPKIGKPIDPKVVDVMNEVGLSMAGAFRKAIDLSVVDTAEFIVSFKPAHELPDSVSRLPNVQYWTITDPQGQSLDFHREVRDKVRAEVTHLLATIPPIKL